MILEMAGTMQEKVFLIHGGGAGWQRRYMYHQYKAKSDFRVVV